MATIPVIQTNSIAPHGAQETVAREEDAKWPPHLLADSLLDASAIEIRFRPKSIDGLLTAETPL